MRVPRPKPPIPLEIPPKVDGVDAWLVVGLDLSLSRTGYAIAEVTAAGPLTGHQWLAVGSVKPDSASDPIWVRGKAMSLFLKRIITQAHHKLIFPENMDLGDEPLPKYGKVGLLLSLEFPTPMNDFLVALNRILHLVLIEQSEVNNFTSQFVAVRVLTTNASTLRSLMGLTMRGSKNKKENIVRAYEHIMRLVWPSLDTDSCDAVLLTEMGRYAAEIMLGHDYNVPERFKVALCNANKEVKGKGTRVRIITKGLLHRDEYWYPYERKEYTLLVKDAANPKPGLKRENLKL
jgi:hypothetical protein